MLRAAALYDLDTGADTHALILAVRTPVPAPFACAVSLLLPPAGHVPALLACFEKLWPFPPVFHPAGATRVRNPWRIVTKDSNRDASGGVCSTIQVGVGRRHCRGRPTGRPSDSEPLGGGAEPTPCQ